MLKAHNMRLFIILSIVRLIFATVSPAWAMGPQNAHRDISQERGSQNTHRDISQERGREDTDVINSVSKTIKDGDGEVTVTVDWLTRPGEFALTIDYFGYLTQEGMVNAYLNINGVERPFVAMREELPNRHQRIRFLSFQPSVSGKGARGLKKLNPADVVDYLLFREAPYYSQFGKVKVEIKFFANGRWDGDGNRQNENFRFEFTSPIKESSPVDHF